MPRGRVCTTEHSPRGPCRFLERRLGQAEIVKRGAVTGPVERHRVKPPDSKSESIIISDVLGARLDGLVGYRIPFDEEVKNADEDAKVRSEALRKNTVWKRVPLAWKGVLILATALMTVSCYLVTIWASRCFRDFAINDTVSKRLKGRWQNIIRPLGVVAVSLFMGSCFLHLLFDCFWYRRQGLVEGGGDSVPADGGGGPVAVEGEELEPPADAPANEEPVAPAPAAAQTTNQSTNVRGLNLEDSWTLQEHVDTGQGQRNSG